FTSALVNALGGLSGDYDAGIVRLQRRDDKSRTDVELRWPMLYHAVFEAKRGPRLPSESQLRKYLPRLRASDAKVTQLVAVTNATQLYAERALPKALGGVDVKHLAWRRVRDLVRHVRAKETNRNKHLLDEFDAYLTEILGMENARSNMVYVVSLGDGGVWG